MVGLVWYDKIGFIHEGHMKGFYVKVVHDTQDTGGYYVLYSKDFSQTTTEGYDEWYLDEKVVESLFDEMRVEWKD